MRATVTELRRRFFADVAAHSGRFDGEIVVLTHLVDDRPELLDAIGRVAGVALVIGKDYSVDEPTRAELARTYRVIVPAAEELTNGERLVELVADAVPRGPFAISEIGGYFADAGELAREAFGSRLVGVVEDTENGEQRYREAEARGALRWPVISVARSPLKAPEDALVGESCVFSTERVLRRAGHTLDGRSAVVIGFGKVGRGAARSLSRRGCPTVVVEADPVRRILARAEGFDVPTLVEALAGAQVVWGATGTTSVGPEVLDRLPDGTVLVSLSSRRVEFAVEHLERGYRSTEEVAGLTRYERDGRRIFLVHQGEPVNFADNAVIGPVLALVQAEIVAALGALFGRRLDPGLHEVDSGSRADLARRWTTHFLDEHGRYRW